ncbi:glycosyl hydrolase [Mycena epipterygia]|nr:glycosyl hydrolase [Mycena epipterygia]
MQLSPRAITLRGLLLATEGICRKNQYIVPGATCAHAGGIVESDGTRCWFGQNEREEDKALFSGINVYSSSDLLNWDYRGRALSPIAGTDISADRVVEWPKAVFNKATQEWVLWFHSDNSTYGLLRQGVATSPNVTGGLVLTVWPGPYTFLDTFSPLGGKSGFGEAYALYSNGDADAAHDNLIARMNANYTNVEEVVYTFFDFDLVAPNMLYIGERYYIFMSHKTRYRPNNVVVFSAEEIAGPWSIQSYIAPSGTRTFNSQSTMTIKVVGSHGTTYLYGGDQWSTSADLYDSRYIWLPAEINDSTGSFTVAWHDLYTIDTKTGKVVYPQGTVYEAEHGVVTGSAYATICVLTNAVTSASKIVTGITGNASLKLHNIVGTGEPQWVSFYYHNPDGLFGDNRGVSGQSFIIARFSSVSERNAGVLFSQPLNVTLNSGGGNTIAISGLNGAAAADLDKIVA